MRYQSVHDLHDAQAIPLLMNAMLNMLKPESYTLTSNCVECVHSRMLMAALEALYAINRLPIGFFSGSVMASLLPEIDPRPLEI